MNDPTSGPSRTVAIVGGGFAGTAVAYHLAHFLSGASILVFEPRTEIGRGLAYDDPDPAHRINVPAARMSLIPSDERHFARWIMAQGAVNDDLDAYAGNNDVYPRRATFGRYVSEHVAPFLARGTIRHIRACVVAIARDGEAWRIATDKGESYLAAVAVLATTHPKPGIPAELAPIGSDPRVISDPLDTQQLQSIPREARVLVVGTGLTMADVVATLDRAGHRRWITAVSRRGLRSHGHPAVASEPYGSFTSADRSPYGIVRAIRETVREASAKGISWHAVLDAVRRDAPVFWAALSVRDRRRIVRHLRVFWDVHRFRIAPQIEAVLERRLAEGTLDIIAASIRSASATPDGLHIGIVRRRSSAIEQLAADYAVVCTGPAHGGVIASLPYLASLARDGWIVADPLRLGIACDRDSRALDSAGIPAPELFIAGPLARATFGELMGVPEVAAHAFRLAETIARELSTAETCVPRRAGRIAQ